MLSGTWTLLVCYIAAATVPKIPSSEKAPFLPTIPGTKWVYQWDYDDKKSESTKFAKRITGSERKGDKVILDIDIETLSGRNASRDRLAVSAAGIELLSTSFTDLAEPIFLLKLPLGTRSKWSDPIFFAEVRATRTAGKTEEIVVPAGKFAAVPVVIESTAFGVRACRTEWYSRGIGLVKERDDSLGLTTSLLSISVPK